MLNSTGEYARLSGIRAMARSRRSKWLNGVGAAAVVAGAALAVGLSPAAPARAAEAAAPNKAATTVEEVFVTASRVNRTGFTAPTPTTVVSAEDLQLRAISNIADALNQSPAFLGNTTPATGGNSTNTAGANFLNLRGMGANRTLVLVNGRRFVPSTSQGILDVNLVPQALVSRVEVVTGGASAAWGSDAVSGVVNFIFDNRLEGGRADVQYGTSSRSDDAQYRVSLAQGGDFGGGRGHAEIAAEWFKSDGILNQNDRPWGRDQWQIFNNPTATATNGQFLRIRSPFVHQSNRTESQRDADHAGAGDERRHVDPEQRQDHEQGDRPHRDGQHAAQQAPDGGGALLGALGEKQVGQLRGPGDLPHLGQALTLRPLRGPADHPLDHPGEHQLHDQRDDDDEDDLQRHPEKPVARGLPEGGVLRRDSHDSPVHRARKESVSAASTTDRSSDRAP